MQFPEPLDEEALPARLIELRGDPNEPPAASVVIPVNAQGDLQNVLAVLSDMAHYSGPARLELVLVVNNYDAAAPPSEIEQLRSLGARVVAIPNVRRPGEAVGFSARIPGIRAAQSQVCILLDADVRIPDATALVDWYLAQFAGGAKAGYTHVAYHDFIDVPSVRVQFAVHHAARWCKRRLGIPTTRGSNYAVDRDVMLALYDEGMLADEMNVGPTFKRRGHRVAYSGARKLRVFTSGRMFDPGWLQMIPYYWYRLRYNLRTLPVRAGVARFTGRERDPVRRYEDNKPIR